MKQDRRFLTYKNDLRWLVLNLQYVTFCCGINQLVCQLFKPTGQQCRPNVESEHGREAREHRNDDKSQCAWNDAGKHFKCFEALTNLLTMFPRPSQMTKFFLEQMKENQSGHIVSIASMSGLHPTPFSIPYSSTKYAVHGFMSALTEHLRLEKWRSKIKTTCVFPYYIKTRADVTDFLSPE